MATMRCNKTDVSYAHERTKTRFKRERELTYVQDDYSKRMRVLTCYYNEI